MWMACHLDPGHAQERGRRGPMASMALVVRFSQCHHFVPGHLAVRQNQWCHVGVGEFTTHFRLYFSGDWDVHWGYGILAHGHFVSRHLCQGNVGAPTPAVLNLVVPSQPLSFLAF